MESKRTDNQIDKSEILENIFIKVSKLHLTPYEIAKNTGLSDTGLRKLLEGKTKNPSFDTLNKISTFIDSLENGNNKKEDNIVDLNLINEKLDLVLAKLEKLEIRIDSNELMHEIMYELQKNSSSSEELKKIEKDVLKKHNVNSSPVQN